MKFSMSRKYRCVCPTITADPLFSSTTQNDNTSIIIAESPGMRNAAGTNMPDHINGRESANSNNESHELTFSITNTR